MTFKSTKYAKIMIYAKKHGLLIIFGFRNQDCIVNVTRKNEYRSECSEIIG